MGCICKRMSHMASFYRHRHICRKYSGTAYLAGIYSVADPGIHIQYASHGPYCGNSAHKLCFCIFFTHSPYYISEKSIAGQKPDFLYIVIFFFLWFAAGRQMQMQIYEPGHYITSFKIYNLISIRHVLTSVLTGRFYLADLLTIRKYRHAFLRLHIF